MPSFGLRTSSLAIAPRYRHASLAQCHAIARPDPRADDIQPQSHHHQHAGDNLESRNCPSLSAAGLKNITRNANNTHIQPTIIRAEPVSRPSSVDGMIASKPGIAYLLWKELQKLDAKSPVGRVPATLT